MDIREAILTDDSEATIMDTTMATALATMAFPDPSVLTEVLDIPLEDTIK